MIKIDEQFSIKKYTYGWELHNTTPSKDKEGNPSESTRVTYHPNIKKVLMAVIDKSSVDCTELAEIVGKIDSSVESFTKAFLAA